jgi:hypothetical protein
VVSGTAPGAAIRARAARAWCRHWRWSNATADPGEPPAAAAAMARSRYDQARPPATSPSGTAAGAITTSARGNDPAAARCHIASHARYGAAAAAAHPCPRTAVAASQVATMGSCHAAARYSRAGGQPPSQAAQAPTAATSVTGAAATRTPAVRAAASSAATIRAVTLATARMASTASQRVITPGSLAPAYAAMPRAAQPPR